VGKDRAAEEAERFQDNDNGRIDVVRGRHRCHQELELQLDQKRPQHASKTGSRGTQIAGRTAQETVPAGIQHTVQRCQVQSTYFYSNQ